MPQDEEEEEEDGEISDRFFEGRGEKKMEKRGKRSGAEGIPKKMADWVAHFFRE